MKTRTKRRAIGSAAMSFTAIILIVVGAFGLASTMQLGTKSGSETGSTSTATVSSTNGLRLTVTSNASEITVGQSLNVSLSIVNTLPKVNSVKSSNDWLLQGVPVSLWPACYFGLPVQVAVLDGNYNVQDIQNAANVTFTYMCMEGVNVDHVIFQPNSDQVNLTGIYDVTGANQSLGPFHMSLSFTTRGSWNLQSLSKELNIPILGETNPWDQPAYVPFTPGEYTVAVADEWGGLALLNFVVSSTNVPNTQNISYTLGIVLGIEMNTTQLVAGHTINITADVFNFLPRTNNVTGASDWASPIFQDWMKSEPCPFPVYVLILRGHYTQANVSSATPLQISPPGLIVPCPAFLASYFIFQSSSDTASFFGGQVNSPMEAEAVVNGYYLSGQSYNSSLPSGGISPTSLPVGAYTVVAGDEWGQILTAQFIVVSG